MIKSQLIDKLAQRMTQKFPHLEHKDVTEGVNTILRHMSDALIKKERIEIRDFGCFIVKYRPARNAHNPRTGTKVSVPPKYTPRFKAGKGMRERVNNSRHLPIKEVRHDEDDD
ncbi:MAG: integration host factor subunit beta [Gammaproteobacteria bacterium]